MNLKKYGKGALIAVNGLVIFFMVYVIAASAGYTVLVGDDFTHGVRVGAFHVPFFQYFAASLQYMKEIYQKMELSARGYYKILKTARTIADLENSEKIRDCHLNEAVCYRVQDKKYWE